MSSRPRRLVRPGVLVSALLAAAVYPGASHGAGPEPATPPAEARSEPGSTVAWALGDFEATWVRVRREVDDEAREQALLSATETMSFLLRGPTRLYMRRTMVPAKRYVIQVDDRRLTIAREPGSTTTFDLDAPEEGTALTFADGELRRDWRHDESTHGTTTWRLTADGQRMTVRRWIRNEMLGGPADYTTTYAREPQGPGADLSRARP